MICCEDNERDRHVAPLLAMTWTPQPHRGVLTDSGTAPRGDGGGRGSRRAENHALIGSPGGPPSQHGSFAIRHCERSVAICGMET
jgi:hypothetical protein